MGINHNDAWLNAQTYMFFLHVGILVAHPPRRKDSGVTDSPGFRRVYQIQDNLTIPEVVHLYLKKS